MSEDQKSSVTIRMPSVLLETIKKSSEQNERSVNSEIVYALSALYGGDFSKMKENGNYKDNSEILNVLKSVGVASILTTLANPLIPIAIAAIHDAAKSIKNKK